MKKYYKISEISKLYGIGIDSLRYYEKLGLLNPKRNENGYRMYSLKDIYKLNIIKDLRRLDFPLKQIKEYMDNQSVENTLDHFYKEQELIEKEIESLKAAQLSLQTRINVLEDAKYIKIGEFKVKEKKKRICLQLNTDITRDEEMDFAIKKLHTKYEDILKNIGDLSVGATLSLEDIERDIHGLFHSVFFILDNDEDGDFILPSGNYLSIYYRGDYHQSPSMVKKLINHSNEMGYTIIGDPFELYEIDNLQTKIQEEFLTELQIQIEI